MFLDTECEGNSCELNTASEERCATPMEPCAQSHSQRQRPRPSTQGVRQELFKEEGQGRERHGHACDSYIRKTSCRDLEHEQKTAAREDLAGRKILPDAPMKDQAAEDEAAEEEL